MMLTDEWITQRYVDDIKKGASHSVGKKRSSHEVNEMQLRKIDKAVCEIKMDSKTLEAEDRFWKLYVDYIEALEE